jgi:hypothetical protein
MNVHELRARVFTVSLPVTLIEVNSIRIGWPDNGLGVFTFIATCFGLLAATYLVIGCVAALFWKRGK